MAMASLEFHRQCKSIPVHFSSALCNPEGLVPGFKHHLLPSRQRIWPCDAAALVILGDMAGEGGKYVLLLLSSRTQLFTS